MTRTEPNVVQYEEQQQLVPMSSLQQENPTSNEDSITVVYDTNKNNTTKEMSSETKRAVLLLRLYLNLKENMNSLRSRQMSDRCLRRIFLLFITLIGITSFLVSLIIGFSLARFKQQCPLYATFKFQTYITSDSNWTVKIIPLTEKFSSQSTCDFCTFYNVFTFIYCIMTGFFFVLYNSDQRIVAKNDECLIVPWFPISLILSFFSLVSASILTNGFLKFCSTIKTNDNRVITCTQLDQLFFEQYPDVKNFFTHMLLAIIASWIQIIFFIGIVSILTIRIGSAFPWRNIDSDDDNKKSSNGTEQSIEQT